MQGTQQEQDPESGSEQDRTEPQALRDPRGDTRGLEDPIERASGEQVSDVLVGDRPQRRVVLPQVGRAGRAGDPGRGRGTASCPRRPAREPSTSPGCTPAPQGANSRPPVGVASTALAWVRSCRRQPPTNSRATRPGVIALGFGGQHLEHPEG